MRNLTKTEEMAEKSGAAEESSNPMAFHHTTTKLVVLADLNVEAEAEAEEDDSSLVPPPLITM